MSLHYSDTSVTEQARKIAKKKTRKFYAIGAAGAVMLTAGGAWAAMTIFGESSLTAQEYQAKNLVISNVELSQQLWPGSEADLNMRITNQNPFPVKITQIAATGAPTAVTPGCDISKVTGPLGSNPAYNIPTADQPTVGGNVTNQLVTLPKAVKLDLAATQGCGFKVNFKVTALQSAAKNP
jgi:hypothetical protein